MHASAWDEYRRQLRQALVVPLGGLPLAGVLGYGIDALGGPEWPFYAIAALVVGAAIIAWVRVSTFPCPACGQGFRGGLLDSNGGLGRTCVHCGLPKWQ